MANLLRSIQIMMNFWGFKVTFAPDTMDLEKFSEPQSSVTPLEDRTEFNERIKNEIKKEHNTFRISRLFECLNTYGLHILQSHILKALIDVCKINKDFRTVSIENWLQHIFHNLCEESKIQYEKYMQELKLR